MNLAQWPESGTQVHHPIHQLPSYLINNPHHHAIVLQHAWYVYFWTQATEQALQALSSLCNEFLSGSPIWLSHGTRFLTEIYEILKREYQENLATVSAHAHLLQSYPSEFNHVWIP